MPSRVSRGFEHRINFGDYEGVVLSVSAEVDCDAGQEQAALAQLADMLTIALNSDLTQARRLAPEDSYIQEWE